MVRNDDRFGTTGDALPLHELACSPWWMRQLASVLCWGLILGLRLALAFARRIGRRASTSPWRGRIVLTGMFVSDGWVRAHVAPLATAAAIERIWVVTDRHMLTLPKTVYVCPPRWLQRIVGRVPARSVWCLATVLRHRPDAVGGFHLLLNGMVALVSARLVGARAMYFCVGGWTETWGGGARSENRLFRRLGQDQPPMERAILRFVQAMDLTLTMGSRAREYLRAHGVTSPIEVVSGGVDMPSPPSDATTASPSYDIAFVGRLVPIKRVDVLLNAVAHLARDRPEIRAVLVGDGPLRSTLEAQAVRLGIVKNVTFAGQQVDVAAWLRRARVFVLPSDSEGLALSVLEAMMCGLPAVVSDVGDLGDVVHSGVNGWRVPRREAAAFADRIAALLDDESDHAAFSMAARRAAASYTVQATADRWNTILRGWMESVRGDVKRDTE